MFGNAVNALLLVLVDDTVGHALEPVVLKERYQHCLISISLQQKSLVTFPLQSPAVQPAMTRAQAM